MKYLLAAAFLVAFLVPVTSSYAQQANLRVGCAPVGSMEQALADKYGEELVGSGVDERGLLFHIWRNEETGTWTILFTDANQGMTCMVSSGDADWLTPQESY